MARRQYRGNAQPTTLAAPVGLSDTTATLTDGSSYPDGTVGPFTLTIDGGAAGEEKWLVTSRSGNGLTGITRAYDGTSAASHSAGASVKHTISAVDLDEANAHGNDTTRDDHAQYGLFKKGLAALIGAAGRSGKLYYKTDLDYLTVDDGSTFHDFQSKAVADGAYGVAAWTTYTPATTNITIGNGTITGAYRLVGKTLNFRIVLTWGSTSVAGTTDWYFRVPYLAQGTQTASVLYRKVTGVGYRGTAWVPDNSQDMNIYLQDAGFDAAASLPAAPATSDQFIISGTFEVR